MENIFRGFKIYNNYSKETRKIPVGTKDFFRYTDSTEISVREKVEKIKDR